MKTSKSIDYKRLLKYAKNARLKAYAPYSKFSVGAALLAEDGKIFTGCNVENISFGLTMCAERVALGAAVGGGQKRFLCIALVSDSLEPVMPCGACRQVLAEFSHDLPVISQTIAGVRAEITLDYLLPHAAQGILG